MVWPHERHCKWNLLFMDGSGPDRGGECRFGPVERLLDVRFAVRRRDIEGAARGGAHAALGQRTREAAIEVLIAVERVAVIAEFCTAGKRELDHRPNMGNERGHMLLCGN